MRYCHQFKTSDLKYNASLGAIMTHHEMIYQNKQVFALHQVDGLAVEMGLRKNFRLFKFTSACVSTQIAYSSTKANIKQHGIHFYEISGFT